MTDGPFKNLNLDRRSKRFAIAVQNEAVDEATRCAYASDAIVNGLLPENSELFHALKNYSQNGQLDFDPAATIKEVFGEYPKSGFANHWQREAALCIHEGFGLHEAILNGLKGALNTYIGEFKTRIHEACLEKFREGEMWKDQLNIFVHGCNKTLTGLDVERIFNALWQGNRLEFKSEVTIKAGLDDGPEL